MNSELETSVKDQLVRFLSSGATPVVSIEGFFHGDEKRAVRGVIEAFPEVFEVFSRGFPRSGPKGLWVRLKRVGDA